MTMADSCPLTLLPRYADHDTIVLSVITTKPVTPPPQPLPIPITHYAGYDDDSPTVAVPIT